MSRSRKIFTNFISMLLCACLLLGCTKAENISSNVQNKANVGETQNDDAKAVETDADNISGMEKQSNEEIVLLDPVIGVPSYDAAAYRTICNAEVYSAIIAPAVEEYSYESDQPFGGYGYLPGEEVHSGDILLYGDTAAIDERIADIQKQLSEDEENYNQSYSDLQQDITESKKDEVKTAGPLQEANGNAPEEGQPGYDFAQSRILPLEGNYKRAALNTQKLEQQQSELTASYNLSVTHQNNLIDLLEEDRQGVVVSAEQDGTVVATGYYNSGDTIAAGTKVMAVGDLTVKQLNTEFIAKSKLTKAQDIYALIDGKRYELEPQIIDSDEYKKLEQLNGVVYSNFIIQGADDLSYGQYGIVVIVTEKKENVLSVPSDALTKSGSDYYVNVYQDGESEKRAVKVGIKDGMYTEILSGIDAGENVLSDTIPKKSKKTQILTKSSMEGNFKETGFLFYPSNEWVSNPAKDTVCYIKELCVSEFEQVEKGQVVARIEAVGDTVEIARLQRKIQREQDRLAVLNEEKSKDYSTEINYSREREIRSRNQAIAKYREQLEKLQKYSGVFEVTSPYTGIVMAMTELKAGDRISYKERLVEVSDLSRIYVLVEDKESSLGYGNTVTITYKDGDLMNQTTQGTVVTVSKESLSSELMTGYALVEVKQEDVGKLMNLGSGKGSTGSWYRTRFTVETQIKSSQNVILIPKNAVTTQNRTSYVRVKDGDKISYVSFVPGGADLSNYWVADGLSEGMEICLE